MFTDFSSLNFIGNVLVLEPWLLQVEQLFWSCEFLTLVWCYMFSYLDDDGHVLLDWFA